MKKSGFSGLRVLVALPMYGGSLPIGRYCVKALLKMGVNVRVYDSPVYYSALSQLKNLDLSPAGINNLEMSFRRVVSQGLLAMAREQGTQIVLALAQAPLDTLVLKKLRDEGIITVMWFVEDYRIFQYWRYLAPCYDAFAIIQKEPFLTELKKIGQAHPLYLPLAALPDFHKPLELSDADKDFYGADISFLGAGYPNRRVAFRSLANEDFKIWGNDWNDEKFLKNHLQKNGARIDEEESVKIYNASKINLNLHSGVQADQLVSNGDFVNPRTFELASIGAFQLVDKRSLMGELFEEDELATFSSIEEMLAKIKYFLANPEAGKAIAEKSRKKVLKEHTYEKRMETLLDFLLGNFPIQQKKSDEDNFLSDLPEEFRKSVHELADSLGLGPNPGFAEIVSLIRRQATPLTKLETAILFLDEWHEEKKFKKPQ